MPSFRALLSLFRESWECLEVMSLRIASSLNAICWVPGLRHQNSASIWEPAGRGAQRTNKRSPGEKRGRTGVGRLSCVQIQEGCAWQGLLCSQYKMCTVPRVELWSATWYISTSGSQTWVSTRIPQISLSPTPRVSDAAGLGGAQEPAFLTSPCDVTVASRRALLEPQHLSIQALAWQEWGKNPVVTVRHYGSHLCSCLGAVNKVVLVLLRSHMWMSPLTLWVSLE